MLWKACAALCLFVAPHCCWAQVQTNGKFRASVACPSKAGSIRSTKIYSPKAVNNMQLLLEAESEESSISFEDPQEDFLKPYKFAEIVPISLNLEKDGVWEVNREAGHRVWRATVTSKSAKSLGLIFKNFYLPPGGELYVVGQDRILGAFVGDINNQNDEKFSVMPLPGETLLLEYYEPLEQEKAHCLASEKLGFLLGKKSPARKKPAAPRMPNQQAARLALSGVTHGFRPYTKNFGDSGSCNVDVACEPHLAGKRQINSVAMLLTQDGTRVCTGAFINNAKRDGKQLFLTAKHCMTEDPSNFILVFNYQVATCGQRHTPPEIQSAHGLTLLHSWTQSDFAIAEIKETIPDSYNVYMAGWDLSPDAPENIYTIHHPTGDVKKISYFNGKTVQSHWLEAPRMFHWKVPTWTKGSTERGSSGAPMFNSRGLIVGHLHGGSASCYMPNGYDNFGGLYFDWSSGPTKETRIRDILNPTGKQISAMKGEYLSALRKHNRSSSSSVQRPRHRHRHHRRREHKLRDSSADQEQMSDLESVADDQFPEAPSCQHCPRATVHVTGGPSSDEAQLISKSSCEDSSINSGQEDYSLRDYPGFRNQDVIEMMFYQ